MFTLVVERFWERVKKTGGCWIWTGASFETHGRTYGQFFIGTLNGKRIRVLAHRFSFELHYGPIPPGLVVDHQCENGLCVRPDHLKVTTDEVNILRGEAPPAKNSRQTHCKRGHLLSAANTWNRKDGRRACRLCDLERVR